jgi:hypothetical protein
MKEMLAGGTVPLDIVLLIVGLATVLLVLLVVSAISGGLELNEYSDRLIKEKNKSELLQKEIDRLTRLNEEARSTPPVVVMERENLPKNWRDLERILNSRENFPEGVEKMSKSTNGKGVVREIGFFRMVVMMGLFAALANMVMNSWVKIKRHLEENENETD